MCKARGISEPLLLLFLTSDQRVAGCPSETTSTHVKNGLRPCPPHVGPGLLGWNISEVWAWGPGRIIITSGTY